jgi:hypothetical protein
MYFEKHVLVQYEDLSSYEESCKKTPEKSKSQKFIWRIFDI